MLQVKEAFVFYGGSEALRGVSIDVPEGEITVILGSNGAGKTTLLNVIAGVKAPASGSVFFKGSSIDNLPPTERVRLGIVQVPEGRGLFPLMSVIDNLRVGAHLRKNWGEVNRDIMGMFERFPRLKERQNQQAGSLSGGEQQMLAVARGLMSKPKLLMMDEPSLGLAPMLVEEVAKIIKTINQEGCTVLLVEQNARMGLSIAHRGYVLETGNVVLQGDAQYLSSNEELKKAYLGV